MDQDNCRLVWAVLGRDKVTLATIVDTQGTKRYAQITLVSADGAEWIGPVVAMRYPAAVRCADPFHVISWATDALDGVRRGSWNDAHKAAQRNEAKRGKGRRVTDARACPANILAIVLKHSHYALWKNPEDSTGR